MRNARTRQLAVVMVARFVTMHVAFTMDLSPQNHMKTVRWGEEHAKNVNTATAAVRRGGKVDVLWLGDSITRRLYAHNRRLVEHEFGHLDTLLEGIDGDMTSHLLYRLANGEAPEELRPTVTVLLIGTNDLNPAFAADTDKFALVRQASLGCVRVLQELASRLPRTKLLVMSILPRGLTKGMAPKSGQRIPALGFPNWTLPSLYTPVIDETNREVQRYVLTSKEMASRTSFVDCGSRFLSEDGNLRRELMPDALHPSEKGYEVLFDCLWPELARLGGLERPASQLQGSSRGSGERYARAAG